MQRIPPELTANARSLRTGTTEAERKLWHLLRHHRPRFTRQLVVDRFIIDIACRSLKVAIELDGGHHSEQIERDAARATYLETQGWKVLRYWNNDVVGNSDGVVEDIFAEMAARASTHPRPLPSREGSREG